MATSSSQRAKLLYLMKILHDKTDAQNPMSIKEIIEELKTYEITAERKSIYTDFEILRKFGLDIKMVGGSTSTSYYLANRTFEVDDFKLLVDAVQSADFITEEKCEELLTKLFFLTSVEQAKIIGETKGCNNADIPC